MRQYASYLLFFFSALFVLPSLVTGLAIISEETVDAEQQCIKEVSEGYYTSYADPVGRCVEDLWKAEAGVAALVLAAALLFVTGLILFWFGWWLRAERRNAEASRTQE